MDEQLRHFICRNPFIHCGAGNSTVRSCAHNRLEAAQDWKLPSHVGEGSSTLYPCVQSMRLPLPTVLRAECQDERFFQEDAECCGQRVLVQGQGATGSDFLLARLNPTFSGGTGSRGALPIEPNVQGQSRTRGRLCDLPGFSSTQGGVLSATMTVVRGVPTLARRGSAWTGNL